jgi:Uma2 family endonuclease
VTVTVAVTPRGYDVIVPPKLSTRWSWTRLVNEIGVDCGFRHDLIDGELFVAPSPNYLHQLVAQRLLLALLPAAPPTLQVVGLPLNLFIDEHTVLQPDLTVVRSNRDYGLVIDPSDVLLVVEVLSPSTRRIDLQRKRAVYEAAGIPSYWIIDPLEPSMVALRRDQSGSYEEVASARGDEALLVDEPFTLSVTPSLLVRGS